MDAVVVAGWRAGGVRPAWLTTGWAGPATLTQVPGWPASSASTRRRQACARAARVVTVTGMRRIGVRHLDNRRCLRPCDYLLDPFTFGTAAARFVLPAGGDEVSLRVARLHHGLVVAIRANGVKGSWVCREWGFGRDVWSEVVAGRRWPGETVLVAMVDALNRGGGRTRSGCS